MTASHDGRPDPAPEFSCPSCPNCPPEGRASNASETARSISCRATADGSPSRPSTSKAQGRTQTVTGRRACDDLPGGRPDLPCEGSTHPPQARQRESACSGLRDPRHSHTEHRTRITNKMHEEPPQRSPDTPGRWLGVLLFAGREPVRPGDCAEDVRDLQDAETLLRLYNAALGLPQ